MNKRTLIREVSKITGYNSTVAKEQVEAVIVVLASALESGENIYLQGLGSFLVTTRQPRISFNPKTSEHLRIPMRKTVKFLLSPRVLKKINRAVE